jgi:hypothetical protein
MADSYHALSSRSMRLHPALRETGGSVAKCDTAARGDSNSDVLKDLARWGAPLDEGACEQQAILPPQEKIILLERHDGLRRCR